MTLKSGWCSGPTGARLNHKKCRSEVCPCWCHQDKQPETETNEEKWPWE